MNDLGGMSISKPDSIAFRVFAQMGSLLSLAIAACGWSLDGDSTTLNRVNRPRNIVLLIGDGMGPQQVALLRHLSVALRSGLTIPSDIPPPGPFAIERLFSEAEVGLVFPEADGGLVVDSAAAGTAIASGEAVPPRSLGMRRDGSPTRSVVELAARRGMQIGLVSDTRLTHATPAAFVAHVPDRAAEEEIAKQILESGVDVLLSGGKRFFEYSGERAPLRTVKQVALTAPDGRSTKLLKFAGYPVVEDLSALEQVRAPPVLGLFAPGSMSDGITEYRSRGRVGRQEPSLKEMTHHALRLLDDAPNGFFLMVEAGQIDWAGHANDAGWLLYEMMRFDSALGEILEWMESRDDTLLLITADHETGSFGLSYTGSREQGGDGKSKQLDFGSPQVFSRLLAQRRPIRAMIADSAGDPSALSVSLSKELPFPVSDHVQALVLKNGRKWVSHSSTCEDGIGDSLQPTFYPDTMDYLSALIGRDIGPAQGIVWGTGTHTGTPVALFALGESVHTSRFVGLYPQTEIGRRLKGLLSGKLRPSKKSQSPRWLSPKIPASR